MFVIIKTFTFKQSNNSPSIRFSIRSSMGRSIRLMITKKNGFSLQLLFFFLCICGYCKSEEGKEEENEGGKRKEKRKKKRRKMNIAE